MKHFYLLLALAAPLCGAAEIPYGHNVECRQLLWSGGDGVSKFYRIPALTTLPGGRIVAVADRRLDSNKDLPGRIDVVCRTSDDGGDTWSPTTVVATHSGGADGGGFGDPALGVDSRTGDAVCVMTHGNGLWESEEGKHAYIYVNRSSDGGRTWTTPVDITPGLFSQTAGEAPVQCISAFATSGRILTDSRGNMWFCLVARPHLKKWSELSVYAVRSTDGGHTWEALPVCVDTDADESKMVELSDGSLLMSIRNRRQGWRKFSRSTDGGKTWSTPELSSTLRDPACNGDILRMADGTLLHSIPDSPADRTNVSIYSSANDGATWEKVTTVCPVRSAYSAMTMVDDDTVGILTEEASSLGGLRLWYTRIRLR